MSNPPPPVPPKPGKKQKHQPSHAPNTHERRQAWVTFVAAALRTSESPGWALRVADEMLAKFDEKWSGR
jgi:hypothetical protein